MEIRDGLANMLANCGTGINMCCLIFQTHLREPVHLIDRGRRGTHDLVAELDMLVSVLVDLVACIVGFGSVDIAPTFVLAIQCHVAKILFGLLDMGGKLWVTGRWYGMGGDCRDCGHCGHCGRMGQLGHSIIDAMQITEHQIARCVAVDIIAIRSN